MVNYVAATNMIQTSKQTIAREPRTIRLKNNSPLIGAGTSSFESAAGNTYAAPTVDISGNSRPNPNGSKPDIGPIEIYLGEPGPSSRNVFDGLTTDTRKISRGYIFFALKGPNFNGNKFASDAIKKGAAYVVIDEENIVYLENPSLGAEDFAFFLQDVPGTMFRLGVAGDKGCAPLHSGYFSLDERSLELGIKILSHTILMFTKSSQES